MNRRQEPGLGEVLAVWALFAFATAEIFATYARLPTRDLYHVSGSGPTGGASRALVFLNFPTALVAIAMLPIVAERLQRRAAGAAAFVALALCATVFVPGVVDQADLDARPVNALAAVGVAIALALTVAAHAAGRMPAPRVRRGDRPRLVLALVLLAVALPWLAADLGFSIDRVPLLGSLFFSEQLWAPLGEAHLNAAVHSGHHHGMDGVLLALSALALSRSLGQLRRPRLRVALSLYLSLMLVYGLANAAQDFWLEQVFKRGWASWSLPSVLRPAATPAWAGIVIAAGVVHLLRLRRARRSAEAGPAGVTPDPRSLWPALAAGALASAVVALIVVGGTSNGGTTAAGRPTPTPSAREQLALEEYGEIAFPMVEKGSDVHVMRPDGGELRNLTEKPGRDVAPAWSPDGRKIAFQSSRDGNDEIYVMNADGSGVTRLTRSAKDDGEVAWSPDGSKLAFVSNRDGNAELYLMDADGSRQTRLAKRAGEDEWPAWSPDGTRIAFDSDRDGDAEIYVVSPDGSGLRRLTRDRTDDRLPVWSPDGTRIAFESNRDGNYELYVMSSDGSGVRRLTSNPADDFGPAWSFDGRKIAFESDRDGLDAIYVMNAEGGGVRKLTKDGADKDAPDWQPLPAGQSAS